MLKLPPPLSVVISGHLGNQCQYMQGMVHFHKHAKEEFALASKNTITHCCWARVPVFSMSTVSSLTCHMQSSAKTQLSIRFLFCWAETSTRDRNVLCRSGYSSILPLSKNKSLTKNKYGGHLKRHVMRWQRQKL